MSAGTEPPAPGGPPPARARRRRADSFGRPLAPVADRLLDAAAATARRTRGTAEADAGAMLASARAQAAHVLDEARAEGERVAARIAAAQLVAARRDARETVLAARRQAYEMLRREAVQALVAAASTPRAEWLGARLTELAVDRLGLPARACRTSRGGAGGLTAVAESGNRRVAIGAEDLVDEALGSMAVEIEGVWR
jgi:hypothetical protein